MTYEPDVDYYIGLDQEFLYHRNPDIEEILPVLNDLFMKTEVALNDLTGACSRRQLNNARDQASVIYDKLSSLRDDYQELTSSLYQII